MITNEPVQDSSRAFAFRWVPGWGSIPNTIELGDVPAIAVDAEDRVYVFARGPKKVIVLNRDGDFLTSWGEGLFTRPHGIAAMPDGSIVCVDDEGQKVMRFSPEGRLLSAISGPDQTAVTGYRPGYPHSVRQAASPFCYPTGAASDLEESGLWVSDGYGNARIHHFADDGDLTSSWGQPGDGPGQFVIPHGVYVDDQWRLLVCDRENERVQILDREGNYIGAWVGVHCPNNIARAADGDYFVAELGRVIQSMGDEVQVVPDAIRARITRRNTDGDVIGEWQPPDPNGKGLWFAPHGIAIDSKGDLYVGEVSAAFCQGLAPAGLPTLHKFVRINGGR